MSMKRLLDTAALLRRRAEEVDLPETWAELYGREDGPCLAAGRADAALIALLGPSVAIALAEWMETTAQDCGTSSLHVKKAYALADKILAAAQETS